MGKLHQICAICAVLVAAFLLGPSAWAQAVIQTGPILNGGGHAPMYGPASPQGLPQVMDSGPAAGGAIGMGLSEKLLQARTGPGLGTGPLGTHDCDWDTYATNPAGAHYLCFDPNIGNNTAAIAVGGTPAPGFEFLINGAAYPFPGTPVSVTGVATVANNTALKGLSVSAAGTTVYREGFASAGDGGAAFYIFSTPLCSLNGGNGDNGGQVQPQSGIGCWNIAPQGSFDARIWGAVGNGATGTSASIQAALNYLGTVLNGGTVSIGASGAPYVINAGLTVPGGVHLRGSGGLTWTSPIDNNVAHWAAQSSWFWCQDTVNPCVTINGNAASVEGMNFWYTQPTPTGGNCSNPCTFVPYSYNTYPYTILVNNNSAVSDWIIDDNIVNASHCVDWEGPTSGVNGVYSGMDRDSFGCLTEGTKFHMVDNTLMLSRLRYELWWEQGNAQWWYAMEGSGNHVDWDVQYLSNPQINDVEFSYSGLAMKFTDASVASGFGNITFAAANMQGSNVSFNEVCQAMAVASSMTHVTGNFANVIIAGDTTTSGVAGQCQNRSGISNPLNFALALNSDNANVSINGLNGAILNGLATIGGGGTGSVHGQLHMQMTPGVSAFASYTSGLPAILTDSTGSVVDVAGYNAIFPANASAGPRCSGAGCATYPQAFSGVAVDGPPGSQREVSFSTGLAPPSTSPYLSQRWILRADATAENGAAICSPQPAGKATDTCSGSNFIFDRYSDQNNYVDSPITVNRVTGNINFNDPTFDVQVTVAALNGKYACTNSMNGARVYVTNLASIPSQGSTVSTGSSTGSQGWWIGCDGTNWRSL